MRTIIGLVAGFVVLAGCQGYEQSRGDAGVCENRDSLDRVVANRSCTQKRASATPYKKI
jgi:hypothetical protein